ncbi:MAG TPA: response regulator [Spongiibacteraceae bacterium]
MDYAQTVKVDDIVQQALSICRTELGMAGHELYVSIMPHVYIVGNPKALADRLALLIQRVANQVAASPIHILTKLDSKDVEIVVRDNPDFIAPHRIRDAFIQRRSAADIDLDNINTNYSNTDVIDKIDDDQPMTQKIDADIFIRSTQDSIGSEYVLRIPTTPPPVLKSKLNSASKKSALKKRRILVVDDNHDVATTLATALQISGYDTKTAHDGATALSTALSFAPHVVLLDIDLPGMNGLQVARSIRAINTPGKPLLIALTGQGGLENKQRAHNAGFDKHYTKPADVRDIIEFIERSICSTLPAPINNMP